MNYLITIVLISVSFVVSLFYTSPMLSEITDLGEKKASLNSSLEETKNLYDIMGQKEQAFNNFSSEEIATINKALPDSIDNVRLIIDIDDIASKYRLNIRNIDLRTERPSGSQESAKNYGTATLKFSFTTTYDRFRAFMKDLEDSLRLVDISSVSFSSSDRDLTDYSIELKTYWLKETI